MTAFGDTRALPGTARNRSTCLGDVGQRCGLD
jgi:hypothetical protein